MALSIAHSVAGENSAAGGNPASSAAFTITAGDIVVIFVLAESTSAGSTPSVTSISDGFNTYALRNRVTYQSNSAFGSGKTSAEIWWAFSSAGHTVALGALTVTLANENDSSTFVGIDVTGFTGTAYQTNPWDQSAATAAGFAVTNNGATQTQLASGANISTVNAACMIICGGGTSDNSATVPFLSSYAVGTIGGTTATDSGQGAKARQSDTNASISALETRVVSATQSSISANFAAAATAGGWAIMPDALSQTGGASGGPSPPIFDPFPGAIARTLVITA
jgi:hypothetical protein